MVRRMLAILLSGILFFSAAVSHSVRAQTLSDTQPVGEARAKVEKLGVGRSARVEVRLRDDTKVKGTSRAAEESFTGTAQDRRHPDLAYALA